MYRHKPSETCMSCHHKNNQLAINLHRAERFLGRNSHATKAKHLSPQQKKHKALLNCCCCCREFLRSQHNSKPMLLQCMTLSDLEESLVMVEYKNCSIRNDTVFQLYSRTVSSVPTVNNDDLMMTLSITLFHVS